MNRISIIPFEASHQAGVDAVLKSIDEEYELAFRSADSMKIADAALLPGRQYWVAMVDDVLVGTVGIIVQDSYATLKGMFLHKDHRGGEARIAEQLLETAIAASKSHNCNKMYLGTMAQFVAAQKFYEKHGFVRVSESELPPDFKGNPVDTIFFCKMLA